LWAFYGAQPAVADPEGVRLISNETGGLFNGLFAITMPGGTQLQILTRDASTVRRVAIPAPSQGVWHHLAAVVDGDTMTLFVDGVPMMSGTQSGFADSIPRAWNIVGTPSSNSLGFVGSIDDVRLFRRPLMPSEIQTLANE
jgi:hypothetical protein